MMKAFDDTLKCAFEDASNRDIACGKALKENSMTCPECGSALEIFPRATGNSVICQNMLDCNYSRFEPYDK